MTTTKSTTKYTCKMCHRVFKTEAGAHKHLRERHLADDLTWLRWIVRDANGEMTAYVDSNANGKYESDPSERRDQKWYVICCDHGMCIGHPEVKGAIQMAEDRTEFCEICSGSAVFCVTCDVAPASYSIDEHDGHDLINA